MFGKYLIFPLQQMPEVDHKILITKTLFSQGKYPEFNCFIMTPSKKKLLWKVNIGYKKVNVSAIYV
jgi:hypothetical protein